MRCKGSRAFGGSKIGFDRVRSASEGRDRLTQLLSAAPRNRNFDTFFRLQARHSQADSCRAASYNRFFAFQLKIHSSTSSPMDALG